MTGFGEASAHVDGVHYAVEMRSLNNKYFKAVIRLPEDFQAFEAEFESRLRERVSRGTMTVTATCNDTSASAAHVINQQALARYVEQLKALPDVASGAVRLDLGALLALPGVLQPPGDEEERHSRARRAFADLLDRATGSLIVMREREGQGLVRELISHRDFISERLSQIRARAPEVIAEYERRLKARMEVLVQAAEARVDAGDLIREIAVYAERTDIAEEIQRLSAHLDQFGEMLSGHENRPLGRTLDFLTQEMLREANTIASKSPDAAVSRLTVEIKGAIDRIKEQVQNVE